jgi:hypothetical protein
MVRWSGRGTWEDRNQDYWMNNLTPEDVYKLSKKPVTFKMLQNSGNVYKKKPNFSINLAWKTPSIRRE